MTYQREQYQTIVNRLREPRKFIQVVMGPRQIGKGGMDATLFLSKNVAKLFD